MAWTNDNPGECDLGQVNGTASDLATRIAKIDTMVTNSGNSISAISAEMWSGSSTDAWKSKARTAVHKASEIRAALNNAKNAAEGYASSVSAIAIAAEPWRESIQRAHHTLNTPIMLSSDATDQERYDAERPYRIARANIVTAQEHLTTLAGQRRDADDTFAGALRTALPSTWEDQRKALAAIGITSAGSLANAAEAREAMLELARQMIDNEYDPNIATALAAMYQLYGEDESFMSDYYNKLGGEDTVKLVDAIGRWGLDNYLTEDGAHFLGDLVRKGLAVGSQNWTSARAEDFVNGMFDAGNLHGAEIGYLFNDVDTALMGEQLSIAAANKIDEWERLDLQTWVESSPPTGGAWLTYTDESIANYNRVNDPQGPIFSTLGAHPDAAFDWLTDDTRTDGTNTLGDDRINYWYDTRYDQNTTTADGFQGVSDLWYGSQLADGGPAHPGDGDGLYDSASLTSTVIQALTDNEYWTPNHISDAASASLAGGFVLNIQGLTEHPIGSDESGDWTGGATFIEIDGHKVYAPILSAEELAVFLGRAGSHEAGAEVLSYGVSAYQETLLNMALGSDNPNDIVNALDRVINLQAALDGSTMGQLVGSAEVEDAQRQAIVSGITAVVGAIPIAGPGVGFLLDWGQAIVISGVETVGSEGISNAWANQTDSVLAQIKLDRDFNGDAAKYTMASSVYEYFQAYDAAHAGDPGYEPIVANIDAPPSGSDKQNNDWYDDYGSTLQGDLATHVQGDNADSVFPSDIFGDMATHYQDKIGNWIGYVRDYEAG